MCCALVSQSCPALCNLMEYIACHGPMSMGFSRQELWSGLPYLPPGDLPNPGIKPRSPALQVDSLPTVSSVQSLNRVRLFATPSTAARQASLSITNSWSLLKLMSIESVMPSNSLILCHPFLLLPSIFPSIRVFSSESVLCIRWPKYWSFRFSISPSNVYSGLISFRMDWLDLLAVQGTLKNLLQHHSYQLSHQDGPQPYKHYKYITVYHIYVTFPPLITFWGYCPANSLPSLQCYSCMDCVQLSLRGQLFLTHFCVSSPDTVVHSAASPSVLTASSAPEAACFLAPEPQVTGSQADFLWDGPHGVSLLVQPGPSPANRPHWAQG